MTPYDPDVIQDYADDLYDRARNLTFAWGAGAGLLGGGPVALWVTTLKGAGLFETLLPFVLTAVIGAFYGYQRTFALRLQAQLALCALQTEINTRRSS